VTGIVDEDGFESAVFVVEDVDTTVILLDVPEARVIQPKHSAHQHLVDHLMSHD